MSNLPATINELTQKNNPDLRRALQCIRDEIEHIWGMWELVLDSKERDDMTYLQSFLSNIQKSFPVLNPDNFVPDSNIQSGLRALNQAYKSIAEEIRERIEEMSEKIKRSDLETIKQYPDSFRIKPRKKAKEVARRRKPKRGEY